LDQSQFGLPVSKNNIQRGDWVLFKTNGSLSINHIGLVLRVNGDHDVQFLHASTSRGVRSDQLYTNYWLKAYVKAIRPYKNNIN
jgi:cell wall-associated NlpC family hydrolase